MTDRARIVQTGPSVQCPECNSPHLRLSKFRSTDAAHLLAFRYPLRCRECRARFFVMLPRAVKLARRHKHKPEQHMSVS